MMTIPVVGKPSWMAGSGGRRSVKLSREPYNVRVIKAPLLDVSQHIEQAPQVWCLQRHRLRAGLEMAVQLLQPIAGVVSVIQFEAFATIAAIPGDSVQQGRLVGAEDIYLADIGGEVCSRTASIFPLRFGRQR